MSNSFLGVDFGKARTGIAISENGILARPLEVLEANGPHMETVLDAIAARAKEYDIRTIVVGAPYTKEGAPTSQSLQIDALVARLEETCTQQELPVSIVRIDEFFSSEEAKRLFPHDPLDAAAAAVILQHYLDENA